MRSCLIGLLLAVGLGCAAGGQDYPTRPITLIVPYPPGGGVDAMARIVGEKLSATLGQQVEVPVYTPDPQEKNVLRSAAASLEWAAQQTGNVQIFDTAGRQEIDAALIEETGAGAPPAAPPPPATTPTAPPKKRK